MPRKILARPVKKGLLEVEVVCSLATRNYKVSATVGVSATVLRPVSAILDTGAGPNLIKETALPEDWERYRIPGPPAFHIVGAGGRRLLQKGNITLTVQLGTIKVQARFIVVEGLAAECILGCQFIDRQVQAIHPKEKRVTLANGSVIPIIHDSGPPVCERSPMPPKELPPSTKVRVSKMIVLPPRSECVVPVQCAAPGLRFLQARLRDNATGVHMANGVAEIWPNQPFTVRVVNTSMKTRRLPKGMILGHALPHPTAMVALIEDPEVAQAETSTPPPSEISKDYTVGDHGRAGEELSPMEYGLQGSPPPLPDRPDAEGDSWKEAVQLGHLQDESRVAILDMLAKHRSMWSGRLGQVQSTNHRIDLIPGQKPVHCQPYRAGPTARAVESAEIERMLKAEVIEPATSEWASPIVLVAKPDGSTRFCVDYRRLNAITVRDSYPLPRMDECIDSLGDAKIFTTLDCNSGYWQIPVRPEDREKTTFTSHEGLYWFLRMPFGLRNAPATFQRFVDITLSGLTWKTCLVYLDDIIVFSKTPAEHMAHLDAVLHRLYRAGLTLNLKKCHFFKNTVDYLGHVIRPGQLSVAEKNTAALKDMKHPTTQTELRSFLGLCNVYRRFVKGFAKIAAPLNVLLRKGETPQLDLLSPDQVIAFDTLRDALLNPPILALPRIEGAFTLDTDASDHQLGCCLLQDQPDGTKHPIGYWSRGLTSAEKNYSTTEKECLAIVWAILHLRPYLEGQKFIIRTDHHSLRWVLNLSDAQGRLARWRLRLLEFDYEVQYHPGALHHGADTMSRLRSEDPVVAEPTDEIDTEVPCFALAHSPLVTGREELHTPGQRDPSIVHPEFLRCAQASDPSCMHLREYLGGHPRIDIDHNGLIGTVLPSREFQLAIPPLPDIPLPVTIVHNVPLPGHSEKVTGDGGAPDLRRGEVRFENRFVMNPSGEVMATEEVPQAISREEIRHEQAMDDECDALRISQVKDGIIDVDEDGILVRIAPLDGSRQIVVPWSLRPRLLWLEHFPVVAAHPGVSKMYAAMRRRFYWRNMYKEVEETVRHCTVCSKNRVTERKRTSFLKLFPASEPLDFVAMDILGPLPKTEHGNRFLLVISDRFSKLTRTVPLRTITALGVAKAFCDAWVFSYGPPRYLLTDNGTQFNAKFFLAVCRELGIAKIFTTAYHPQTNGQVERFNRTIINSLRGYVERRQNDWDEYTSAITFGYNCRVHSSLQLAPFELILSRPPPTLSVGPSEAEAQDTPASAKLRFLTRIKELVPLAQTRLSEAQAQYKRNFDRSIKEKNKEVLAGSWVYLRREVHEAGRNPKLDDPVDGPYRVVETDGRVFKLRIGDDDVPVSSDRITPAPVTTDETRARDDRPVGNLPPPGDEDEDRVTTPEENNDTLEGEYVFERITGMRQRRDGSVQYKVRWYGYGPSEDTWEPSAHLPADALRRYRRRTGWTGPK